MLIVLTILGCMILLSIYSKWERNQLTVEYYRILSKKIKSPCRFVFLSDLHEKEFGCGNKRLLEEIDRCHPDFVLIGGDLPVSRSGEPTDERDRVEKGIALLEELTRKYRVYYSFGNHEEKLFSKKECCGRKTLFEKALSKTVQVDGRAVWAEEEAEKRGGICLIGLPLDLSYYQVLLFKKKPWMRRQGRFGIAQVPLSKIGRAIAKKKRLPLLYVTVLSTKRKRWPVRWILFFQGIFTEGQWGFLFSPS